MKEESEKLVQVMKSIAKPVDEKAEDAATLAGIAKLAADSALESATDAYEYASDAKDYADDAKDLARAASDAADRAETAAAEAAKTATDFILPIKDQQGNISEIIINTEKAATEQDITNASARLTENSLEVYVDDESVASYGSTARIGKSDDRRTEISSEAFKIFDPDDNTVFEATSKEVQNYGTSEESYAYIKVPKGTSTKWSISHSPVGNIEVSINYVTMGNTVYIPETAQFVSGTATSSSLTFTSVDEPNSTLNATIKYDGLKEFEIIFDSNEVNFQLFFDYTAKRFLVPQYKIGLGLENGGTNSQVVLGRYNFPLQADCILEVGSGKSHADRKNAFRLEERTYYDSASSDTVTETVASFEDCAVEIRNLYDISILDYLVYEKWKTILGKSQSTWNTPSIGMVSEIFDYIADNIGSGGGSELNTITVSHTFAAQSAGSSGYVKLGFANQTGKSCVGGFMNTPSVGALNGAQFSIVNMISGSGSMYFNYYFPKATSQNITITWYLTFKKN